MKNGLTSALFSSILILTGAQAAFGSFGFTVSYTQPTGESFVNLNGATLGNGVYAIDGDTFNETGSPTGQGFVTGASSGNYAVPILVPGSTTYSGTYLSSGIDPSTPDILSFSPQTSFSLLWGSVDTYNTLVFLNSGTPVGTITGGDVLAAPLAPPLSNGSQGPNGSAYVTVTGVTFNQVEFLSSSNSFEAVVLTSTPEPALYGILGAGLLGLAGLGVRRRRKPSVNV
jgi:MYXO-CTERM domain-containing protein